MMHGAGFRQQPQQEQGMKVKTNLKVGKIATNHNVTVR
jgi:hypothetical protein